MSEPSKAAIEYAVCAMEKIGSRPIHPLHIHEAWDAGSRSREDEIARLAAKSQEQAEEIERQAKVVAAARELADAASVFNNRRVSARPLRTALAALRVALAEKEGK